MRLPWFSQPLRLGRAAKKRRRKSAAPLSVRRLERRRVLNASIETTPAQLDPAIPVAVDEGTHVTASATVTGSEPFTYSWTLTQGGNDIETGIGPGFEFDAPDDGVYQLSVDVLDSEMQPSSAKVGVQVKNVAPELTAISGDTIVENATAKITAKVVDPGAFDVFSVDVNWLDGTNDTIAGLGLADSSGTVGGTAFKWTAADRTLELSHKFLDDGPNPGGGVSSNNYDVQLLVHDDDMGTGELKTAAVTVNNALPVLSVPPNKTRNEGELLSIPGADPVDQIVFTDAGKLDTHTAQINWGDGFSEPGVITPFVGGGTIAASHTYADDGVYTVVVRLADDDMSGDFVNGVAGVDFVEKTFTVTVNNVNPVVVAPHGDQSIVEGGTISFSDLATFTDPGFDNPLNPTVPATGNPFNESFTYDIDWGDGRDAITGASIVDLNGSPGVDSSGTINGSHTYADNGVYTVRVTVHDDNGGSHFQEFKVTVSNALPVLSVPPNKTRNEGELLSIPGADPVDQIVFTDAGKLDTHTAQINWGDGFSEPGVITPFVGGGTIAASHTYADDGVYTVVVRLADDDMSGDFVNGVAGVDFVEKTFTVTVNNVNPVVVAPHGDQSIVEGATVSFSDLATFTDPGFDNPLNPTVPATGNPFNESFTYDIDWGDGQSPIVGMAIADMNGSPGVNSSGTISGSHTYADDGTYIVKITVHDDNGGSSFQEFKVTVNNALPVLSVPPNKTRNEGELLSIPGADPVDQIVFTDAGKLDTHTAQINWGDGFTEPGVITPFVGGGTIAASHTYADDGVYTVVVRLADDDMSGDFVNGVAGVDFVEKTFTVTVNNVNPVVVAPHGDQSIVEGATVSFSDLATFTDPGFDNPLNPTVPATGNPFNESFTYDIDWGDGRDAITGASIVDLNGSPGVDSSGTINGSHTYADNGVYTVRVTVHDDNGGSHFQVFTVTVTNVDPELTGTLDRQVNEGQAFTLTDLGIGITDPGFDNPLNTNVPPNGGETVETFTSFNIAWGDGSASTPVSVVNRVSGSPNVPTTAQFSHLAHTYADDGVYTVAITLQDDDGAVVTREFTITVNNVKPTLFVAPNQTVAESGDLVIATIGSFTDPGFDNPFNPTTPALGDRFQESFTYDINWGDGRQELANVAVADTNGSPGVPSSGSFGGSHVYADDGVYTVTVTIRDDNGGATVQTFTVTVTNISPSFVPVQGGASFEGDDVTSTGLTKIRVGYNDPGFDNPLDPNAAVLPNIGDPKHESFAHVIDWGDGTIDAIHTYPTAGLYTITVTVNGSQVYTFANVDSSLQPVLTLVSGQTLFDPSVVPQLFTFEVSWGDGAVNTMQMMLALPGAPLLNTGQTTVFSSLRTSGNEAVLTNGSFEVQHRYFGPPNPQNPTADIPITVTVMDDNNGSVADSIAVPNPGIQVINVAIDTTPDVPRLLFVPPPAVVTFLGRQSSSSQGLLSPELRVARSELTVTADRYLELVVVYPDGTVSKGYRLKDEALQDLRALFATLPDNRYRIYLVRTENNSRRLVMEVYVRNGRVIDPTDDSEGTRDRPPTSEQLQQPAIVPLDENLLFEKVPEPDNSSGATNSNRPTETPDVRSVQAAEKDAILASQAAMDLGERNPAAPVMAAEPEVRFTRSSRWAAPLAALSLGAGGAAWSRRVNDALEQADDRDWRRLRRAGRIGWRGRKALAYGGGSPSGECEYNISSLATVAGNDFPGGN